MIDGLLRTALPGSAVVLAWLAADALLEKRLPALWHYRVLKLALFLFLVPVWPLAALTAKLAARPAPAVPVAIPELLPVPQLPVTVLPAVPTVPTPEIAPVALSVDLMQVLTVVWAVGAAAVLGYKLWAYIRFRRRFLAQNRPVSAPETQEVFAACRDHLGLKRAVALRENPIASTPLSTGLLRPTVVLPVLPLSREELRYLFLHELTHVQKRDLWIRFFSMLAAVIHWYDPLVHLLNRRIKEFSEQSCDERVSAPLGRSERFAYGSILLKLAAGTAAGPCEWAVSLSAKDTIERRLIRVMRSEKLKGRKRLLALALAAVILSCGTAAAFAARGPLVQRETGPQTIQNVRNENDAPQGPLPERELQKDTVEPPSDTGAAVRTPARPAASEKTNAARPGEAAKATALYPDAVRGNTDLILARGGTLLPDDDPAAYRGVNSVVYKAFIGKDGYSYLEYMVGNKEALLAKHSSASVEQWLSQLVNGDYPKNKNGESYGLDSLANYVGYHPDLYGVTDPDSGLSGYVRRTDEPGYDIEAAIQTPEDAVAYMEWKKANPGPYQLPMYDANGNVIGQWTYGGSGGGIDTSSMTIEEAKAILASGAE
ncbi:M56 family metallopeptidase [uncultured Dysosmobacter sp.]|uniref:M56 family metallopeptidase n=1 Tax=uncultured Dysosmobacter sp. TaxID=2591384 RepID=UPI00262E6745|nr:M56 family metallopeptidase [uncultured Dysosmobacter sp.]